MLGILSETVGVGNVDRFGVGPDINEAVGPWVFGQNSATTANALGLCKDEWGKLSISDDGDIIYNTA